MKPKTSFLLGIRTFVLVTLIFHPLGDAHAQWGQYGGWHMGPGMMGEWGMGWFGMILMMAFWILVIVGLVFLIKWLVQATRGGKEVSHSGLRAFEILKERYARGEIDKAEFDQKKKDIMR